MNSDIKIRYAAEQDAGDITRIYNYAILNTTATFDIEPKTLEDRMDWLREHSEAYPVIVALLDDKVVGWAAIGPYGERAAYRYTVENAVYVDCDYQGRGIGRALLAEIVYISKQIGYHVVIALIVKGNDASVRLHERLGFELVGTMREVGYKFDTWLDLLVLEKLL